ncbi:LINE-1 type transposase domain-containing protein 1 isoform 3-T35 [Megaptera novaeangliae]
MPVSFIERRKGGEKKLSDDTVMTLTLPTYQILVNLLVHAAHFTVSFDGPGLLSAAFMPWIEQMPELSHQKAAVCKPGGLSPETHPAGPGPWTSSLQNYLVMVTGSEGNI